MSGPGWLRSWAVATVALLVLGACTSVERGAQDAPPAESRAHALRVALADFESAIGPTSGPEPERASWHAAADGRLHAVGAAVRTRRLELSMAPAANGALRLRDADSDLELEVVRLGARAGEPLVDGGLAWFSGAGPSGSDLLVEVRPGSVEDYLRFAKPPRAAPRYRIGLTAVAGLRLAHGVLEFLDASGVARLRVSRPYVVDAGGRFRWAKLRVEGCDYESGALRVGGGSPVAPGAPHCELVVDWDDSGLRYPLVLDPRFSSTDTLADGRAWHLAVRVPQGALVIGGQNKAGQPLSSVELYRADTGSWQVLAPLSLPRFHHTATLLGTTKVYVIGGWGGAEGEPAGPLAVTELLDLGGEPQAWQWQQPPELELETPRARHTAVDIDNNDIVVTGGGGLEVEVLELSDCGPLESDCTETRAAMMEARFGHATAWSNGSVYVIGGAPTYDLSEPSATVWAYDVAEDEWRYDLPEMNSVRVGHTAVRLDRDADRNLPEEILIVGGTAAPQLFESNSGVLRPTDGFTNHLREGHAAVELGGDAVLMIGGKCSSVLHDTNAIYERVRNRWLPSNLLLEQGRMGHSATLLPDQATVLVAGGEGEGFRSGLESAETGEFRALGESCMRDSQCISGHCVQGICCDDVCSDGCETCLGGDQGEAGTCRPRAQGSECGEALSCQESRECNGTSRFCPAAEAVEDGQDCTTADGEPGECGNGLCQGRLRIADGGTAGEDGGAERDTSAPTPLSCSLLSAGTVGAGRAGARGGVIVWLCVLLSWLALRRHRRARSGVWYALWCVALAACGEDFFGGPDLDAGGGGGTGGGVGGTQDAAPADAGHASDDFDPRCPELATIAGVTWSPLDPALPAPPERSLHAMVSTAQGALLYGGGTELGALGDSWLWRGRAEGWALLEGEGPPARGAAAMAYDEASGAAVLIGGTGDSHALRDAWLWDGSWSPRCSGEGSPCASEQPAARMSHRMAYDREREALVLFGGRGESALTDETWEWTEAGGWQRRCGGVDPDADAGGGEACGPPPRVDHGIAFDRVGERVLLYGGTDGTSVFDDVWGWDGERWSLLGDAGELGARSGHAMVWDSGTRSVVVFGGTDDVGRARADLWRFSASLQTWSPIEASAQQPPSRRFAALARSTGDDALLLHGGDARRPLGDTWLAETWLRSARAQCECSISCESCDSAVAAACIDRCTSGAGPADAGACSPDSGDEDGGVADAGADDDAGLDDDAGTPPDPGSSMECARLRECCEPLEAADRSECLDLVARDDPEICLDTTASCPSLSEGAQSALECVALGHCCVDLEGGLRNACRDALRDATSCKSFLRGGWCPADD